MWPSLCVRAPLRSLLPRPLPSPTHHSDVLDITPSSPRAIDRTLRRLADSVSHAYDDEYQRPANEQAWRDELEVWERTHREYVEGEMLAHKEVQWAEDAVSAGKESLVAMQGMLARVIAEVAEMDRKLDAAATRVEGVLASIDDLK